MSTNYAPETMWTFCWLEKWEISADSLFYFTKLAYTSCTSDRIHRRHLALVYGSFRLLTIGYSDMKTLSTQSWLIVPALGRVLKMNFQLTLAETRHSGTAACSAACCSWECTGTPAYRQTIHTQSQFTHIINSVHMVPKLTRQARHSWRPNSSALRE